jgi:DNA-binding CsgD family transcriptional regulator
MPEIDEHQLGTFSNLAPYMRRAVLISDLLEARSMVASSFEATLDGIASAVLLVDPNARITYANPRAEAMLRESETITQLNGRLLAPRELVKGHLERTVAAASQPGETVGPASGIPVRRQDGTGQVIHVLPLERRADRPSPSAVAAVFVAEPNAALNLPLEAIRALYDLRPAEMRTLQFVASGLSAKAVAEALSVSESTAKTHTLRLFDKLGVHTRAELVSFVRNMSLGN